MATSTIYFPNMIIKDELEYALFKTITVGNTHLAKERAKETRLEYKGDRKIYVRRFEGTIAIYKLHSHFFESVNNYKITIIE